MYIVPVGNQVYLYDRDEKRVGKYADHHERVPEAYRVSKNIRHISVTKAASNQEKSDPFFEEEQYNNNNLSEDWLGENIDIKI